MLANYDTISSMPCPVTAPVLYIHLRCPCLSSRHALCYQHDCPSPASALLSPNRIGYCFFLPSALLNPQPVCLRICSFFSSRGSASMERFFILYSRFSRCSCLLCFSVGRLIDQLSWRKMFVLMAAINVRPIHTLHSNAQPTIDAVRTQNVRALCPPACRALVQ